MYLCNSVDISRHHKLACDISCHLYIFHLKLTGVQSVKGSHCKTTHVGPDVLGSDRPRCQSRYTKTSDEKLIWQPFKGKSFPQVNYFGGKKLARLKLKGSGAEWESQVCTDGSYKPLCAHCCLSAAPGYGHASWDMQHLGSALHFLFHASWLKPWWFWLCSGPPSQEGEPFLSGLVGCSKEEQLLFSHLFRQQSALLGLCHPHQLLIKTLNTTMTK